MYCPLLMFPFKHQICPIIGSIELTDRIFHREPNGKVLYAPRVFNGKVLYVPRVFNVTAFAFE